MALSDPEIEEAEFPEAETESFAFRAIGGDSAVPLIEPLDPIASYDSSLLAIANVKGLFVAAGAKGFKISELSILYEAASSKAASVLGTFHTIPDRIQSVAFTGDETLLVVGTETLGFAFYEVDKLTSPGANPKGLEKLTGIKAISPNPAIGCDIAVLHNDCVSLFDLNTGTSRLLCSSGACSICWSPMGKQLVVGTRDGDILQYAPNGDIRAAIPRPEFVSPQLSNIIKLVWLETNLFLAVYSGPIQSGSHEYEVFLITRHKPSGNLTFSRLLDPCPPFGLTDRAGAWFANSFVWNKEALPHLLTLAATPSPDITLMTNQATLMPLDDSARATLPLSGHSDTSPVGSGLDFTATHTISNPCPGVEESGPMPILWVLNNEGKIKGWSIIWVDGIQKNLADISQIRSNIQELATKASQSASCVSAESKPPNILPKKSLSPPVQSDIRSPPSAGTPVFGQSAFAAKPAERSEAITSSATSAFSSAQPSAFGKSSFGSPLSMSRSGSPFSAGASASSKSAFGQSTFGSASGSTGTASAGSSSKPAFGQPSFGQSSFGGASNTSSLQGNPPPATGSSVFGSSSSNKPAFGQSTFGSGSASPADSPSSTGPAFGKSVFGQSNFRTSSAPPFASGASPFGAKPAFGQSSFGASSTPQSAGNISGTEESSSIFSQKKSSSAFGGGQSAFGNNPFTSGALKTQSKESSPFSGFLKQSKQPSSEDVHSDTKSLQGSIFSNPKSSNTQNAPEPSRNEGSLERMRSIFGHNTSAASKSPIRPDSNNEGEWSQESEESDNESYISDDEEPYIQNKEEPSDKDTGLSLGDISLNKDQKESKPDSSDRLSESPIIVSSEIGQEEPVASHESGTEAESESERWESGSNFSEASLTENERREQEPYSEEDENSLSRSWQNTEESEDEKSLEAYEPLESSKNEKKTEEQVVPRHIPSKIPLPPSPVLKSAEEVALPSPPSLAEEHLPLSPPPSPKRIQDDAEEIALLSKENIDEHPSEKEPETEDFPPFTALSPQLVETENNESQRAAKISLPCNNSEDSEFTDRGLFPPWGNEDEDEHYTDNGPLPPFGDEGLDNGPLPPFGVPSPNLYEESLKSEQNDIFTSKDELPSPQSQQKENEAPLPPFGVSAPKLASNLPGITATKPQSRKKEIEPSGPAQKEKEKLTPSQEEKHEHPAQTTDQESGLPPFGVPTPKLPTNLFGNAKSTQDESSADSGLPSFGAPTPKQPTNLFGNAKPTQNESSADSGLPPFGVPTPKQPTNLFGNAKSTQDESSADSGLPPFDVPTPKQPTNLFGNAKPAQDESSTGSGLPPFGVPTPKQPTNLFGNAKPTQDESSAGSGLPPFSVPTSKTSDSVSKNVETESNRPESAPPQFASSLTKFAGPAPGVPMSFGMQRDTGLQTGMESKLGDSFARKPDTKSRFEELSSSSPGALRAPFESIDAAIQTDEKEETPEPEVPRVLAELPAFDSNMDEPTSDEKGLAREFDLLYMSIEHYMDMLYNNSTNFETYIKEQAQEPPLFDLSEKSLESIANWQLADAATIGSLLDNARKEQEKTSNVQEYDKILRDIRKLDIPLSNLTMSVRRVGELIHERYLQDKSNILNSQQLPGEAMELQRAVRKAYNLCDERMRILEKEIVVIKANLVSQGGIEAPSLSRIRRSIKKISEMAERKRIEIRTLERKVNELQLPNDKKRQSPARASTMSPAPPNKASVNEMDVELLTIRKSCRSKVMRAINNRKSGPMVTRQS